MLEMNGPSHHFDPSEIRLDRPALAPSLSERIAEFEGMTSLGGEWEADIVRDLTKKYDLPQLAMNVFELREDAEKAGLLVTCECFRSPDRSRLPVVTFSIRDDQGNYFLPVARSPFLATEDSDDPDRGSSKRRSTRTGSEGEGEDGSETSRNFERFSPNAEVRVLVDYSKGNVGEHVALYSPAAFREACENAQRAISDRKLHSHILDEHILPFVAGEMSRIYPEIGKQERPQIVDEGSAGDRVLFRAKGRDLYNPSVFESFEFMLHHTGMRVEIRNLSPSFESV